MWETSNGDAVLAARVRCDAGGAVEGEPTSFGSVAGRAMWRLGRAAEYDESLTAEAPGRAAVPVPFLESAFR